MKEFIKREKFTILFTAAGALGGFLYWRFVGCNSGTCPIRSVWYWSTLWGAAVGYLAGDLIGGMIKKRKNKSEEKR
ncbi:MAG: DUF6132 family protein [Prolixibacteraceae bacterium]|nr:DUF6132 family protein [Prolixibacteraceae bacterium]